MFKVIWEKSCQIDSKIYVCPYCSKEIATNKGFKCKKDAPGVRDFASKIFIAICYNCHQPTFFLSDQQYPNSSYGNDVEGISSDEVKKLYKEARGCFSVRAFTASVMCSRKLLMNYAVAKGADTNKSFKFYVEYLSDKNYVPPDGKRFLDHIRNKGNEANHEIDLMEEGDAKLLIDFLEMLFKFNYEFPLKLNQEINKKPPPGK